MHDCLLLPPPDERTDPHFLPLRCCAAELYRETYVKKVSHVEELATSINNGLLKLEQASADVDVMKVELREKEKARPPKEDDDELKEEDHKAPKD